MIPASSSNVFGQDSKVGSQTLMSLRSDNNSELLEEQLIEQMAIEKEYSISYCAYQNKLSEYQNQMESKAARHQSSKKQQSRM